MDWATAEASTPTGTRRIRHFGRRSSVAAGRSPRRLPRKEKHKRGVLDLDDLLGMTIEAIESNAELAASVQWRIRHVLVDEAQDLNPLQHRLVELFSAGHDELFLVGDPARRSTGSTGPTRPPADRRGRSILGIEIVRLPSITAAHRRSSTLPLIRCEPTGSRRRSLSARPDAPWSTWSRTMMRRLKRSGWRTDITARSDARPIGAGGRAGANPRRARREPCRPR